MLKDNKENDAANPQPRESGGASVHGHSHYGHHHCCGGFNFGRLFFGLLVLVIGLFYLARNAGWLPADLHFNWSLIWPLLIIVAGLSLMTGRGWLSGIISVILIILLVGAVLMVIFGSLPGMSRMMWPTQGNRIQSGENFDFGQVTTTDIGIARDPAAKAADISMNGGAGKIILKGGGDALASGTFSSGIADLITDSKLEGTRQIVTMDTVGRGGMMFGRGANDLDLVLTREVPVTLEINTGAAELEFDLTRVVLEKLNISSGASSLKLALGDKAKTSRVSIKAGASNVIIELPATVGAKLVLKSTMTSRNLEGFEQVDDSTFKTVNYDLAEKKIDLNLELGISSLEIKLK